MSLFTEYITVVNLDSSVDLLEGATILKSVDTGSMMTHRVSHPTHGELTIVVSNCSDENLVIRM